MSCCQNWDYFLWDWNVGTRSGYQPPGHGQGRGAFSFSDPQQHGYHPSFLMGDLSFDVHMFSKGINILWNSSSNYIIVFCNTHKNFLSRTNVWFAPTVLYVWKGETVGRRFCSTQSLQKLRYASQTFFLFPLTVYSKSDIQLNFLKLHLFVGCMTFYDQNRSYSQK